MNSNKEKTDSYDDIINMPHHVSHTRSKMSARDRAAQFSPFAALTGYGDAVKETARETHRRKELSEEEKLVIDGTLQRIYERLTDMPEASITYFVPDENKDGGDYVTVSGRIMRINTPERVIAMSDGRIIPIDDVISLEY